MSLLAKSKRTGSTAPEGGTGSLDRLRPIGEVVDLPPMRARKVQVKDGRLVLDEPTDLPDGAEVEVLIVDDELTPEERAELHASLDRALDDSEAGPGMDVWDFLERYRARGEVHPL